VLTHVKPERDKNKERRTHDNWWRFKRVAKDMRAATGCLESYVATPRVSKHRIFVLLDPIIQSDDGIFVFARSDYFFFGLLTSQIHETWARAQGTQVRERESGFRYTPTTCFETFPFPEPTDKQRAAIADAAKELDTLRNKWLNPPGWTREEVLEFPGSADGPWARFVSDADNHGIGTVRYPRLIAKDEECAKQLRRRTLTNLYNERPTWLDLAHRRLDAAVSAAYGWPADLSDDAILERLLQLNLQRAAAESPAK
jgi:type II restriction/modification system DNA methylase subunit YeeA